MQKSASSHHTCYIAGLKINCKQIVPNRQRIWWQDQERMTGTQHKWIAINYENSCDSFVYLCLRIYGSNAEIHNCTAPAHSHSPAQPRVGPVVSLPPAAVSRLRCASREERLLPAVTAPEILKLLRIIERASIDPGDKTSAGTIHQSPAEL